MTNRFGLVTLLATFAAIAAATSRPAHAVDASYRALSAWQTAAGWPSLNGEGAVRIDWDDVVALDEGEFLEITGERYSSLPGSPVLSVDATSNLYVGNPDYPSGLNEPFYGLQPPVSETNILALNSPAEAVNGPEGILTVQFGTPITSIGAWFLDVEGDFANTGIKINGVLHAFEDGFDDASQDFLGVVSDTPFTEAELHFSTNFTNGDGVFLDDLYYTVYLTLLADIDQDGDVDGVDLGGFFSSFTGPGGGPILNPATDLDSDGDVDGVDLAGAFGEFTGPQASVSIPEPSTIVLLGLGGLLVRRHAL